MPSLKKISKLISLHVPQYLANSSTMKSKNIYCEYTYESGVVNEASPQFKYNCS